MTTTATAVLSATWAMVQESFSNARVLRNADKPPRNDPGGLVIMRDGENGDAEMTLGVKVWTYVRRVVLEIAPFESEDPDYAVVVMLRGLKARLQADPFLGGLADYIEPEAPVMDDSDVVGAQALRWAEVGLLITYTTTNPLG